MKRTVLSISFALIALFTYGQSALYVGSSQVNVGFGLSDSGIPIYLGFDHCIARDFTLGLEGSYRAYNENWHNDYYNHNIIGVSGNANYHFNTIFGMTPRWDLYAGANVGFYAWSSPDGYDGNHHTGLGLGGQFGARYYFTNSLGLNLEFGGGNAFNAGKIGLSFRL